MTIDSSSETVFHSSHLHQTQAKTFLVSPLLQQLPVRPVFLYWRRSWHPAEGHPTLLTAFLWQLEDPQALTGSYRPRLHCVETWVSWVLCLLFGLHSGQVRPASCRFSAAWRRAMRSWQARRSIRGWTGGRGSVPPAACSQRFSLSEPRRTALCFACCERT